MTITLYKCANDPDTLNKTFSNASSRNGTPYEPIDDLSGYVILDYTTDIESYNAASLTIGSRTKYYTITSRAPETGHKVRVNLSCDVLATYETEIRNIGGILSRTANDSSTGDFNAFIIDSEATFQADMTTITVPLGAPLVYDREHIVLCTIGCDAPNDRQKNNGNVSSHTTYTAIN